MTTWSLTWLITLAIFVQVAAWAALAFLRHWGNFLTLRERATGSHAEPPSVPTAKAPATTTPAAPGWEGFRPFRVSRKLYEDEAHSICSFYLMPVDGAPLPAFEPGQYLTFQFALGEAGDGSPHQVVRCYSLSDRPRPDYYRITVKRVPAAGPELPAGRASNHLHDRVEEGDVLMLKPPAGQFHLQEYGPSPIALIGGGIGITPMLSIAKALLHAGSQRDIWLFYGVRNRADHAMREELAALAAHHPNLHLHICYSRPGEGDTAGVDYQHAGRISVDLLRLTLPRQVEQFYVCGPPPLMETLVPELEDWGVAAEAIHYEAFGPASVRRRNSAPTQAAHSAIQVTFSKSGKQLAWNPAAGSLLEFAEEHGIKVDSGCRAGNCGCCQTRIEDGEVDYHQQPDAEVEAGACLLCVSTPKQDLTLTA